MHSHPAGVRRPRLCPVGYGNLQSPTHVDKPTVATDLSHTQTITSWDHASHIQVHRPDTCSMDGKPLRSESNVNFTCPISRFITSSSAGMIDPCLVPRYPCPRHMPSPAVVLVCVSLCFVLTMFRNLQFAATTVLHFHLCLDVSQTYASCAGQLQNNVNIKIFHLNVTVSTSVRRPNVHMGVSVSTWRQMRSDTHTLEYEHALTGYIERRASG
jgi:hypothetical protein